MICVSIGRGRHKHVIAEHAHLAEEGAQLVELRLDYIAGEVNLKRLIEQRPCPVIVSCRRPADGGKWHGSEAERMMLLRTAIAEGVEYVDLEDDVASSVPRYGNTKRIISLHDFTKTPDDLPQLHARLASRQADLVKLATMANHPHDNLRMLQLIAQSQVPTVGMCMGDMGTPSRILAAKFGAPFTYATFHHERALAPGQLSFRQMMDIYHYDQIDPQTRVYGVIADPIGHSLSPIVHNAAFQDLSLNSVYVPFRVSREHLAQFIQDCPQLGIRGLSVMIPHKEAVLGFCTKVDRAVQGIGAANTLVFQDDQVIGYNTDYRAALDSLAPVLRLSQGDKPLAGHAALLLGSGGVAKAIAFGLTHRGAQVIVAARRTQVAETFTKAFGCRVIDWESRHSVTADVLINCTPIGMHPNVDETPFDRRHLRPSMTVFDTVYNPEQTLLIKEARRQTLCGRHRSRHVRSPGRAAVPVLHGTAGTDRLDAGRAETHDRSGSVSIANSRQASPHDPSKSPNHARLSATGLAAGCPAGRSGQPSHLWSGVASTHHQSLVHHRGWPRGATLARSDSPGRLVVLAARKRRAGRRILASAAADRTVSGGRSGDPLLVRTPPGTAAAGCGSAGDADGASAVRQPCGADLPDDRGELYRPG